uniref:Chitin-binding type-2 domain-containing protein n=1 Tax=Coptotermes formosanus TaxID=36987 RepID=R4V429_COPFO|nr:hypothetical protein [Coptotermes formosanus]
MGKGMQMILVIILATIVMFGIAQLELSPGRNPDVALLYARLRSTGVVTLAADFNCSSQGASVINCTTYRVCGNVDNVGLVGAIYTCPAGETLDPATYECSPSYVCSSPCTGRTFICHTNTTYTLCIPNGISYSVNSSCPNAYYCNEVCSAPCLNHIPDC